MSQGHYGCTIAAVLTQFKVQRENERFGQKKGFNTRKAQKIAILKSFPIVPYPIYP
jgi:hypothetical protein